MFKSFKAFNRFAPFKAFMSPAVPFVLRFENGNLGVILLLAGGDKASQSKDIAGAKRYWHDFREATHGKAQ